MQLAALKKAGCEQIFTDKGLSGATIQRPALARCLKALAHGDTLTVWKLDRLGRSVRDLLNILHDLQKRGIQFESLTDAISTETPTGRAMLHMVALLAELESDLIAERTRRRREGRARPRREVWPQAEVIRCPDRPRPPADRARTAGVGRGRALERGQDNPFVP